MTKRLRSESTSATPAENDDLALEQFIRLTGEPDSTAKSFLRAHKWDTHAAIDAYYTQHEMTTAPENDAGTESPVNVALPKPHDHNSNQGVSLTSYLARLTEPASIKLRARYAMPIYKPS